ncbi:MAG: PAS domain S-box protein [Planctomycetes bacterium]|nr:PAS domain S-box protein [Planctomycetota bacterium]
MMTYNQAELAEALLQEIGDALFLLDPETDRLIEVNPVVLRLTGFTRYELLQLPATHLFRYEAAGGVQRLRSAFSKTMVFHGQDGFLLRTKDDAWIPVNLTVSRLHINPTTLGLIIARDDRERRQAFAQARRVESELRQVLSNSPAALWSAERNPGPDVMVGWQFRYVSPLLARLAGRPADYFDHPFKWAEVIHPVERDSYRNGLRRLLTGSTADAEAQYRVVAADGTVRWIRDRLQVVRDASGRPTRLDGCLVDVTEQRQSEEALRQREQRFRALVEKSRDGIMLLDEGAVIRYATPAIWDILGYDPASITGRIGFDFVYPEDMEDAHATFEEFLNRPGEDVASSLRAIAADGSIRIIELNGCNRLDDPSVRAVVVNYRDVTERETTALALARHSALLEGLFASVPDIVCYKDRERRFLGGNPAFEELTGQPMVEMIGKKRDELSVPGDWAERMRVVEEEVLATGETKRAKEWVAFPNGRQVLLDIAVSPLRGDTGELAGLIVTGRDVTEQSRLEDQLRQSHKLEAVGRLAGGIAHDFNNLLTIILGNLELIRSGGAGDEEPDLLLSAERAAKQAAELTKQMLGFARRQPLKTETLDLNTVVSEAIKLLRRTIDPRISIRVTLASDLNPVAADLVQVQQVLMNLSLNARDAMPDGGTLTIETSNAPDACSPGASTDEPGPAFVRVSVSDTGIGMTDEVRAKIFEPFFTTKDVGQGTGLGLAVVYGVARAHGGWVECSSELGVGSRFDVYLPQGTISEEAVPEVVEAKPSVERGHGETVLVADDEPLVLALARGALERQGYRVLLASDGAEAVEVFRRERAKGEIALVILDVSMPALSGRQASQLIRKIDPAVPVLFASGHPNADLGMEPGTGFMQKPYTPSSLAAAIRKILDAAPTASTNHSVV